MTTLDRAAVLAELDSFRNFKPGWDGAGSVAIPDTAIAAAKTFVEALPDNSPALEACPHGDGAAGLFLNEGDDNLANIIFYADIMFRGEGRMAFYAKCGDVVAKGIAPWPGDGEIPADLSAALVLAGG
jgi:hypothetical protein